MTVTDVPLGDPTQVGADVGPTPRTPSQCHVGRMRRCRSGGGHHRDTHEVEIGYPAATPIATITLSDDSAGYAELLGWIFQHRPIPGGRVDRGDPQLRRRAGPRGHRAGLLVIEREPPNREQRRGKFDRSNAHLGADRRATRRRLADHSAYRQ